MHSVNCSCSGYPLICSPAELNKRRFETKKILAGLGAVAEDQTGEHRLLQCADCGQHWQRSLAWMSGNHAYLFKVPAPDSVETWKARPFVQPDVLFSWAGALHNYLRSATFEEQPRQCCEEGCEKQAIRYSGLCAFHHLLNIGLPATPPGDYQWCEPYKPEDYRITPDILKSLPGYQSL